MYFSSDDDDDVVVDDEYNVFCMLISFFIPLSHSHSFFHSVSALVLLIHFANMIELKMRWLNVLSLMVLFGVCVCERASERENFSFSWFIYEFVVVLIVVGELQTMKRVVVVAFKASNDVTRKST